MAGLQPHILFIDHEPMFRESLKAYLEDSGYHITLADNGRTALDAFHSEKPDVIITEIDLPVMNGLELIQAIRESDPHMPVIVLTGITDGEELIQALRLGINDYLMKPLSDLSLVDAALQKSLEKKRLKEENAKIQHTLLEDQQAGKTVQEKILPSKLFEKGALKVEHHVEPMLYLSGDFVDYFEVDDDHFVFYLSDVSGHGAAAAFVTLLIKMYVRDQAAKYRAESDQRIIVPHLLVQALAKEIHSEKLDKYCTILYFVYYKKTQEIHYCVAGNYPNPVLMQNGKTSFLEGRGFPVGIAASMSYTTEVIELKPPYKIVLYSDGIFEILSGDFEDKDQHLLDLTAQTDGSLEQINNIFKITTTPDRLDDISVLVFSRGED